MENVIGEGGQLRNRSYSLIAQCGRDATRKMTVTPQEVQT